MKTVTVKAAEGSTHVRVGKMRFAVGEPQHDVPEDVVTQLEAMPGVETQVDEPLSIDPIDEPSARRKN